MKYRLIGTINSNITNRQDNRPGQIMIFNRHLGRSYKDYYIVINLHADHGMTKEGISKKIVKGTPKFIVTTDKIIDWADSDDSDDQDEGYKIPNNQQNHKV